ncbi:MAG: hypothetical protein HY936_03135 [Nitrosomonadales bacterium]|nr:hypothetical protein [Nitrosomonadales bacterium]
MLPEMLPERRQQLHDALLLYCERDTLAMVRIALFPQVIKPVLFSRQSQITNAAALGYGFDIGNTANDFEFHTVKYSRFESRSDEVQIK